jgi:hypothetical protein
MKWNIRDYAWHYDCHLTRRRRNGAWRYRLILPTKTVIGIGHTLSRSDVLWWIRIGIKTDFANPKQRAEYGRRYARANRLEKKRKRKEKRRKNPTFGDYQKKAQALGWYLWKIHKYCYRLMKGRVTLETSDYRWELNRPTELERAYQIELKKLGISKAENEFAEKIKDAPAATWFDEFCERADAKVDKHVVQDHVEAWLKAHGVEVPWNDFCKQLNHLPGVSTKKVREVKGKRVACMSGFKLKTADHLVSA